MKNEINVKKDKHYYVLNTKQSQEKVEFNFFKYTLFLSTPRRSLHHSNIYSARPFKRLRSCWCSSSCSARCSYLIILKNLFLLPILKFFTSFPWLWWSFSFIFSFSKKNTTKECNFLAENRNSSTLQAQLKRTRTTPCNPHSASIRVRWDEMRWASVQRFNQHATAFFYENRGWSITNFNSNTLFICLFIS